MKFLVGPGKANRPDTVRILAIACIALAALDGAREVATLIWSRIAPSSGTAHGVASSLAAWVWYWFRLWMLLVGGAGLLYRQRWASWVALGCVTVTIGATIVGQFELASTAYSDPTSVRLIVLAIVGVFRPRVSITLFVFLLLPSVRAAFRDADDLREADTFEASTSRVEDQVRAMGWLILVFAVVGLIQVGEAAIAMRAHAAEAPPDWIGSLRGYEQWRKAFAAVLQVFAFPSAMLTVALGMTAGFGMAKFRTWAWQAALLFTIILIVVAILSFGLSAIISAEYPVSPPIGSVPAGSVARAMKIISSVLALLARLIFPLLLLAFIRLPQIRESFSVRPLPPVQAPGSSS